MSAEPVAIDLTDPPDPTDPPDQYARRNLILAVMCLALVMVVSGVSMITNALPHLAASLGASQSDQQWIIDAYGLTLAALLLPAGALGDRYGRRGALIAGVIVFGLTALLSVWVDTPDQLIALRAVMAPARRSTSARPRPSTPSSTASSSVTAGSTFLSTTRAGSS